MSFASCRGYCAYNVTDLLESAMSMAGRAKVRSIVSDSPRGIGLLRDPLLNKGTAFTEQERDALGLRGLLPAHVLSMQAQAERVLTNLRSLRSAWASIARK